MKYINLFIVGAAKAGTTFLYEWFKAHPQVGVPHHEVMKEPGIFASMTKRRITVDQYMQYIKDSDQKKWLCDASTAYLTDPGAAQQIHNYNPEAKIIIVLRNPIDRAYSLYNWMVQEGYEWAPTFQKALKLEDKRRRRLKKSFWMPEYPYNYLYKYSGLYWIQLLRYFHIFSPKQIKIVVYDDLRNNVHQELRSISQFLSLDDYEPVIERESNPSLDVKSPTRQFIIRKALVKAVEPVTQIVKGSQATYQLRRNLIESGWKTIKPKPISPSLRKTLSLFFKDDIKKTESFLRIELKNWYSVCD